MRHLFCLTLSILVMTSCKFDGGAKTDSSSNISQQGVGNIIFHGKRKLSEQELSVARRVCQNLKIKKETIRKYSKDFSQNGALIASSSGELTLCGLNPANYGAINVRVMVENLIHPEFKTMGSNTNTNFYFQNIIFNDSQMLADTCTNVEVSDSVDNFVELDGNKAYALNFRYKDASSDVVEWIEYQKNSNGFYEAVESNSADIRKSATPEHYVGFEMSRTRYKLCENAVNNPAKLVRVLHSISIVD